MKFYFFIAIFLLMNAFFIISQENIQMNSMENISSFFDIYLNWFKTLGGNFTSITGNIINLDWVPQTSNKE